MVDIHSHILFGVDDGCKSIEDSLSILKKAIEVGVSEIILTPHYSTIRDHTERVPIIRNHFNQLQQKVVELKLPINLMLGHEIDYTKGLSKMLNEKKLLTLNASPFVLIDFIMQKENIDECIYNLIVDGYIPIIAHPERYRYIKDKSLYSKWKETGAYLQIDASSLYHPKTKDEKKNVKYLIKHHLVDFVGSDIHCDKSNYDDFKKMHHYLDKKGLHVKKIFELHS